jgi:putative tryptophan/tyrosine transport system substrate-binding protein
MRRRDFLGVLGGAVVAWPRATRAQQGMPVIGYLSARSPDDTSHLVTAFRRGLAETGVVEGQNVTIEYRWAIGQYDRLAAMAAELVQRRVSVIASTGGEPAALAAKASTSVIPIVFAIGGDPIEQGLVKSFNRPSSNATGITLLNNTIEAKRLGLLRELIPQATAIGVLLNANSNTADHQLNDVQAAGRAMGVQVYILQVNVDRDFEPAFETAVTKRVAALTVASSPFFDTRREKIIALTTRYRLPTMYGFREFTAAGGLMSYGVEPADAYRQVGVYTGRVLKGETPSNLPVLQATKFEFVINQKTARTLGLKFSDNLTSLADEVIE